MYPFHLASFDWPIVPKITCQFEFYNAVVDLIPYDSNESIRGQRYTLQCVLPINNFTEKIYVFLWFWFAILGLLTTLNTLQWALNTILPSRRVRYIKQYLKALRLISSTEERDCARFVNNNLGADGVFILHVVSKIASDLIALDVTATLWKNYRQAKITGTEEDVNRLLETVNRGSSVV
ncbi:putative innexin [Schistosoma mansoni]|uniref:putative innexin n=1 Tax=Schistosoma mansoni TaxID=6183 RepID=UPI0001A62245|nr:putative innexin [Schistosoma mansoni]|eukprot:XP_018655537.1 putative innexin [Schistosoma mansoni]